MTAKRRVSAFDNEIGDVVTLTVEIAEPLKGHYQSEPPTWIDVQLKAGSSRGFGFSVTPIEARGLIRALEAYATSEQSK